MIEKGFDHNKNISVIQAKILIACSVLNNEKSEDWLVLAVCFIIYFPVKKVVEKIGYCLHRLFELSSHGARKYVNIYIYIGFLLEYTS